MAVTEEITKVQAKLKLNNGTDADGNIKTLTISMPQLSLTATGEQIMAMSELVTPLLTKSVYAVEKVQYSSLVD